MTSMMPNQISISLTGASPKLQPSFPEDNRSDVTVTFNQSTTLKLRKAYLKCWSKYFEKELPQQIQKLQIAESFDPERFTKVMSTFYGHTQKISLRQLPQYLAIANFLQIKEISENVRNHLMAYYQQFDILALFKLSVSSKDQQVKEFVLSILLNRNFDDLSKRKQEILDLSIQQFKYLAEYVSKNIQKQSHVTWVEFNNLLREFAHKKSDPELYLQLRDEYINVQDLRSNEFSIIYSDNIKLPPTPRHQKNLKSQLSQLTENKSVLFDNHLVGELQKSIEKHDKNQERFEKLLERINKLEEKNQSVTQLFGKTSTSIGELRNQFKRLNSRNSDMMHSESRPFVESKQIPKTQGVKMELSDSAPTNLNRSSSGMEEKISSQEPMTFSIKPQAILQEQYDTLEKILGFDCLSKGFLKQIYRAEAGKSRDDFLKAIDGKEDLVFLIEVFEDSKNIGVYTSTKINVRQEYITDCEAFIFSLNHNAKFRTVDESKSIRLRGSSLIQFSEDIKLNKDVLQQSSVCNWPVTYEGKAGVSDSAKWLVGNREFYASKLQVYEIIRIEIKIETDLD